MSRTPEFDAVRGLAALAIVVLHLWFPSFTPLSTAVNLFFVLSGYLITSIILRNLDADNFLAAFYARRALRIWPIYYLALAAVVAFNAVSSSPEPIDALPYFATHTQHLPGYWFSDSPAFIHSFLHTWTLAIEEQFYLVWPLLLFALGRRAVAPLAALFIAASVAARACGFQLWILLTQADGLALGGLLAALLAGPARSERGRARLERALVALALLAVVHTVAGAGLLRRLGGGWVPVAASTKVLFTNVFYFSVVGGLVLRSGAKALRPLRDRRLVYLGTISYGIYLYHYIIIKTMERLCEARGVAPSLALQLAAVALVLAVSAASWRFVERPILALKDRIHYDGAPAARRPAVEASVVPGA